MIIRAPKMFCFINDDSKLDKFLKYFKAYSLKFKPMVLNNLGPLSRLNSIAK